MGPGCDYAFRDPPGFPLRPRRFTPRMDACFRLERPGHIFEESPSLSILQVSTSTPHPRMLDSDAYVLYVILVLIDPSFSPEHDSDSGPEIRCLRSQKRMFLHVSYFAASIPAE